MGRRRLFNSYFYINHDGTTTGKKYKVGCLPKSWSDSIPSFTSGGGSTTIELVTGKPWLITKDASWLSISNMGGNSGIYSNLTLTAEQNPDYTARNGSFTAKTLDDKYSIIVAVSQEPIASSRYIYITPSSANIGPKGTTALTCYLFDNGVTTDITSNVGTSWSSNNANVSVSAGGVTGNNDTEQAIVATITATYDGMSATATINVSSGVVSYSNFTVSPSSMSLGTGDTNNGKALNAYLDKYINGTKVATLTVTSAATYDLSNTAITYTKSGSDVKIKPVYESGVSYPSARAAVVTVKYSGNVYSDTCDVTVAARPITYVLEVSPNPVTMGAHDETQLTAIYYVVTDGVRDNGTDVTSAATYTDGGTSAISVSNGGKITSNNTAATPATDTVVVSYGNASNVNVPVTATSAQINYILEVTPSAATVNYRESTNLTVMYYIEVNGTRDAGTNVTSAATYSEDNSAVTVNQGSVTGNNTGDTSTSTTITISYGNASDVQAVITSNPANRVNTLLVWPTNATIGPTGSTQMNARYCTWIGETLISSADVQANSVTWSIIDGSDYATIGRRTGGVIGSNSGTSAQTVTVQGVYSGLTGTSQITVNAATTGWANLRFVPSSMTLGTSDLSDGKNYVLMVDRMVNGNVAETITLTGANAVYITASAVTDTGNSIVVANENVKPVYDHTNPGTYYPSARQASISATFQRDNTTLTATLSITVSAEGLKEYNLFFYFVDENDPTARPVTTSMTIGDTARTRVELVVITDGDSGNPQTFDITSGRTSFIDFTSNNTSVATVNSGATGGDADKGKVTAVGNGTTTIAVVVDDIYEHQYHYESTVQVIVSASYQPSISWDSNTITVPAYRGDYTAYEPITSATFSYVEINSIPNAVVIEGSDFIVKSTTSGVSTTSTGNSSIWADEPNRTLSQITLGKIRISGHGLDDNWYSDNLIVYQAAGVTPRMILQDTSSAVTIDVPSSFTNGNYSVKWEYVDPNSVGTGTSTGNITGCNLVNTGNSACTAVVTLTGNSSTSSATSTISFTGTSVYGDTVSAILTIVQSAGTALGSVTVTPVGQLSFGPGSGSATFSITSSNMVGNLTLTGVQNVSAITNTSGQIISSVPANTTTNVRVIFNPNTSETNNRWIEIEASGLDTNGVTESGSGHVTQENYPGYLHYVQNGLSASTTGNNTYSIDKLSVTVRDTASGFSETYVWNNVGIVNNQVKFITSANSYTSHTSSSQSAFTLYADEIEVKFTTGYQIPTTVNVMLPNTTGGTNSYFLTRSAGDQYTFVMTASPSLISNIVPSMDVNWPNTPLEIILHPN